MTMKMISSTSITSTMGVTLILELTLLPSSRTAIAIVRAPLPENFYSGWLPALLRNHPHRRAAETGGQERVLALPPSADSRFRRRPLRLALVALLDEVVDQFAGGVVHLHVESFDTSGEVVEGHDGRDGHEQAERRW